MKKALAVTLCSLPLALSSITLVHADGTGKTGAQTSGTVSGATDTNRNNNDQAHDGSSIDQTSPNNTYGSTGAGKNDSTSAPRAPDKATGANGTSSAKEPGKTYPDSATDGPQDGPTSSPQGPAPGAQPSTNPDRTYPDPKPGTQNDAKPAR